MTLTELKAMYTEAYKTIDEELKWRNKRYPVGHEEREQKLGEMKRLLVAITAMKDEIKGRMEAEQVRQPRLLDVPGRTPYG